MRKLWLGRVFWPLAVVIAVLISGAARAEDAAGPSVNKVLISDGTYREIANTGTINAVNRVFGHDRMPASAKTEAITAILGGASAAGMLMPTRLVEGDLFFALDAGTGTVITVKYEAPDLFTVPSGSTEFSRMWIPPG
jgi:hypothetical protein